MAPKKRASASSPASSATEPAEDKPVTKDLDWYNVQVKKVKEDDSLPSSMKKWLIRSYQAELAQQRSEATGMSPLQVKPAKKRKLKAVDEGEGEDEEEPADKGRKTFKDMCTVVVARCDSFATCHKHLCRPTKKPVQSGARHYGNLAWGADGRPFPGGQGAGTPECKDPTSKQWCAQKVWQYVDAAGQPLTILLSRVKRDGDACEVHIPEGQEWLCLRHWAKEDWVPNCSFESFPLCSDVQLVEVRLC